MKIILADNAGFCFGVNKAINLIYELLDENNGKVYCVGPVIHNELVIKRLEKYGLQIVESSKDINHEGKVVIRTHGISARQYENIKNKEGLEIVDATCPYVKKIHNLVNRKKKEGFQTIIVGDRKHQEVKGINGWCNNEAIIVNCEQDVDKLPESDCKTCIVAQTTIRKQKWERLCKRVELKFRHLEIFNTICNATEKRQKEAARIAQNSDMMLVIGSRNSSNTKKLYQICKKYCKSTYQIETVGDIPSVDINKIKKTGITAGASTPDWLIKEVLHKMEELNKNENEINIEKAFENSIVTLHSGQTVKGKIIGFNESEVFVDLGYKSDGIISMDEFNDNPDFDPEKDIKEGGEIEVFVNRVDDKEGNVYLSKKKVDRKRNWEKIEKAYKEKTPVEVEIVEIVKGGVIAKTNNIKIFIPASHVSDKFVKDLSKYLNKTIMIKIIEYNRKKRKLVGSNKVLIEEENERKAKEVWDNIEEGKEYDGTVRSITGFGVFVDIGGVDGLVHISELSWSKIRHPSEIVNVNDLIKVRVLDFDKEKGRISLGYRKAEDNPWYNAEERFKTGDNIKGKVVRIVPFGVFVNLAEGIDGLVHISQISNVRIAKASDVLEVGQEVEAKITDVDIENKKIGLSIKEVNPIDPEVEEKVEKTESFNKKKKEKKNEKSKIEHKEDLSITIGDMVEGIDNRKFMFNDVKQEDKAQNYESGPEDNSEQNSSEK